MIAPGYSTFHYYSGSKPNIFKCEIGGIGALKEVYMAVCCLKSVGLTSITDKILGLHFSYNKELQRETFKILSNNIG